MGTTDCRMLIRQTLKNILYGKPNTTLNSFADHLTAQYGEHGAVAREEYEEEFEAFKLGAMIQEVRKKGNDVTRTCGERSSD